MKTNAVRMLESEQVDYELIEYNIDDGLIDGISVAEKTNQPLETVYKTLVTRTGPKALYVFLIPVAGALDLKKAAQTVGVKKLEMLPVKDLMKETGYIRGGCSPVGMKRKYQTVIDESALNLGRIVVSGGKPGVQIVLSPQEAVRMTDASFADLVKK